MSEKCPFCDSVTHYDGHTPEYRWCDPDDESHYYSIHLDGNPVKEYFRIDFDPGYLIAIRQGGQTIYLDTSGLGIKELFIASVEHSFEQIKAKFDSIIKSHIFK